MITIEFYLDGVGSYILVKPEDLTTKLVEFSKLMIEGRMEFFHVFWG